VGTLIKVVVVLGVIILAIGLVVGVWSVPTKGFGPYYEHPFWLTGLVLVVGGVIIGALGFLDPGRKRV
jgi:hypothetical protein